MLQPIDWKLVLKCLSGDAELPSRVRDGDGSMSRRIRFDLNFQLGFGSTSRVSSHLKPMREYIGTRPSSHAPSK